MTSVPPQACIRCGYPVYPVDDGDCPECGASIAPTEFLPATQQRLRDLRWARRCYWVAALVVVVCAAACVVNVRHWLQTDAFAGLSAERYYASPRAGSDALPLQPIISMLWLLTAPLALVLSFVALVLAPAPRPFGVRVIMVAASLLVLAACLAIVLMTLQRGFDGPIHSPVWPGMR